MDYKIKDYQTRMPREPNTQYVLSLSYGKDSLACLEAIRILGLPLDRIVHAEVWATDTIPADLPPMVEFKKKADKIILERYGIVVEHICAVERERETALIRETVLLHPKQQKDRWRVYLRIPNGQRPVVQLQTQTRSSRTNREN